MMKKSPLPKTSLVTSYDAPLDNRAEWFINMLSSLKTNRVYRFIHHGAYPPPKAREISDLQNRRADDYRALRDRRRDRRVKALIEKEFVLLTYHDLRDAMRMK